jgi:hypothetical protein
VTPVPGFRARSVADFAELETRNANLRVDTRRGFLEAQFHVITQIRAALRTAARSAAPAAASENIFEAEEVAENILELVEDRLIHSAIGAAARYSRVTETVIGGALLPIRQNRVRFGCLAKLLLCFLFLLGITIRMPLQGSFAVGGFHFVGGGGTLDSEHFIAITFLTHRLILLFS